jgi:hypothetical protein
MKGKKGSDPPAVELVNCPSSQTNSPRRVVLDNQRGPKSNFNLRSAGMILRILGRADENAASQEASRRAALMARVLTPCGGRVLLGRHETDAWNHPLDSAGASPIPVRSYVR